MIKNETFYYFFSSYTNIIFNKMYFHIFLYFFFNQLNIVWLPRQKYR